MSDERTDTASIAAGHRDAAATAFQIVVVDGPDTGRAFPLDGKGVVVGRDPSCQIRLIDRTVSRQHFLIRVTPSGLQIEDKGSANETLVNGQAVREGPLRSGDRIIIGATELLLLKSGSRAREGEESSTGSTARLDRGDLFGRLLVGCSSAMQRVRAFIARAAPVDSPVLILGESGVGKELVARALHYQSPRRSNPMVSVSCATLNAPLLESDLFGHEEGAFTGAIAQHPGKVELATGGTLFLDEVGDLDPSCQAKLLRVLEERAYFRVGGTVEIPADVRIVAATNRPLEESVEKGAFRDDLFYRLDVLRIAVQPLRERVEDIPLLVHSFLDHFRRRGLRSARVTPETMKALTVYRWPGNVRELKNAIEQSLVLGSGDTVEPLHLPEKIRSGPRPDGSDGPTLDAVEKRHIASVLKQTKGNKSAAAEILGIPRSTLYSKLRRMGIP